MQWEFIIALAVAIPVIIFPAALVWYLNVGGLAIKRARERRAAARYPVDKVAAVVGRQQESK